MPDSPENHRQNLFSQASRPATVVHDMALGAGEQVGKYEIETVLWEVSNDAHVTYRARHTQTRQLVEVMEYLPCAWAERLNGTLGPTSSAVKKYHHGCKQFLDGARALENRLQSVGGRPHVAAVETVFQARGTVYMVTEHVEGSSLATMLEQDGARSAAWVWRMLDGLTASLAVVHGAGLVHGAISPARVRVKPDGTPVLVGFGIGGRTAARAIGVMGGYAAPEQYTDASEGPWTDVYALGAVAYTALSTREPPTATERTRGGDLDAAANDSTAASLPDRARGGDPLIPLAATAPAMGDAGLASAVMAALALVPEDRPSDLGAWRVQLGLASPASTEGTASRSAWPPTDRWWRVAGVAAIAMLMVVVAVLATQLQQLRIRQDADQQLVDQQLRQIQARQDVDQQLAEATRLMPGLLFRDCEACPLMTVLPAGRFEMGSDDSDESAYENETPQRTVTIERPFAVGVAELTFAEWDACAIADECDPVGVDDDIRLAHWDAWGRELHPVKKVNWGDVQTYVNWLSRETGHEYRLLTEAEWEYAARAGTTTPWYWGRFNDETWCRYANGGTSCDGVNMGTAPVRSYLPNQFGLYDMAGNVLELVEDCYIEGYHDAPSDGSARTGPGDCDRVLRGGSWYSDDGTRRHLRSANRRPWTPYGDGDDGVGFRVAMTLD